ncbi:MAG: hypothetical protein H6741_06210 [Alphaproteobacteria bacterium]|nr:hypothetical protein [Alphaproteobacteria bacterium]MCB9792303.1 hypothetical protein [Alphaproteobacteria bacterium]
MTGAHERYLRRQRIWAKKHRALPLLRHHAWWLVHNCASHPLLGLRVSASTIWFHDWTSQHLNQRVELRPSPSPEIPDRLAWASHNILGHLAIGLFPCERTFDFHDRGSEAMNVPMWL